MTDDDDPALGARLYGTLYDSALGPDGSEASPLALVCALGGAITELAFATDDAGATGQAILTRVARVIQAAPAEGAVPPGLLPSPHALDTATEAGRGGARIFWEDGPSCEHAFAALLVDVCAGVLLAWEGTAHIPRARGLRVLAEVTHRAMAFEFAAQELCDAVIERRLTPGLWGVGECITALAAAAGRRQALALGGAFVSGAPVVACGLPMPGALNAVACVMTREAVRGGVEAGTDWRFGLAANDMPLSAPVDLIRGVEPVCQGLFRVLGLPSWRDQAVACAKAAGRMLAVAAGGSLPEIEPAIAKPLAMAALAETYRYVSHTRASMTG
ncbi:MAG: hypothetical protein JKP92_09100 [Alphaproteobacteria bacterium]|jgi:hypothetical protein|nr:hypothetical protein [Alphaproteobacteria bacterium]